MRTTETERDLLPDPVSYDKVQNWDQYLNETISSTDVPRLVIVGASGTGKTRAMLDLFKRCMEEDKRLAILREKARGERRGHMVVYPVFNSVSVDKLLGMKRCDNGLSILDMIADAKDCSMNRDFDNCPDCPFAHYVPSEAAFIGIDDLQYFSGKKQLQFLYTLLENNKYIVITIQIPQSMPPEKIPAWLIERWAGQCGQYQAEAEKVIRLLFDPLGLTVIQMTHARERARPEEQEGENLREGDLLSPA